MLRDLFLNFCVVTTLTYLVSLTYTAWPLRGDFRRLVVTALTAAACSLILMQFPAPVEAGVNVDFRLIPVALVALRFGLLGGVLAALPVGAYRLSLGGLGLEAALLQLALTAALVPVVRARLLPGGSVDRARTGVADLPATALWWVPLVVTGAQLASVPLLPNPAATAWGLSGWVLTANVLAFAVSWSVLSGRFRMLRLAHGYREQAVTDALTGLPNRRLFLQDAARLGREGHLLLLDIDHFKRVNDQLGHETGDLVLREVATALRLAIRPDDRVYRIGGEEFAVLLTGCSTAQATVVAERIRERVRFDVTFNVPELPAALTVSGGLVDLGSAKDLQEAKRVADARLYEAKQNGRDQVRGPKDAPRPE